MLPRRVPIVNIFSCFNDWAFRGRPRALSLRGHADDNLLGIASEVSPYVGNTECQKNGAGVTFAIIGVVAPGWTPGFAEFYIYRFPEEIREVANRVHVQAQRTRRELEVWAFKLMTDLGWRSELESRAFCINGT
jgi:hypothetical protein